MKVSEEPDSGIDHLGSLLAEDLRTRLFSEAHPGRRMDIICDALCPPEPQLLDTSVLQNLDWVHRRLEGASGEVCWDKDAVLALERRYGKELAVDLLDLGTLYQQFEHYGAFPWLICDAAVEEAAVLQNDKGVRLRGLISFLSGHQGDLHKDSYPGVAHGLLLSRGPSRVSPLVLRALGIKSREEVHEIRGPLSFLPDKGDRLLVGQALFANIPAILTTDRRTLWGHCAQLRSLGVDVFRPSELLNLYSPYWHAVEIEFARRRAMAA